MGVFFAGQVSLLLFVTNIDLITLRSSYKLLWHFLNSVVQCNQSENGLIPNIIPAETDLFSPLHVFYGDRLTVVTQVTTPGHVVVSPL